MLSQIHFVLHFGSLCHISCGGYIRLQVIPEEKDNFIKKYNYNCFPNFTQDLT